MSPQPEIKVSKLRQLFPSRRVTYVPEYAPDTPPVEFEVLPLPGESLSRVTDAVLRLAYLHLVEEKGLTEIVSAAPAEVIRILDECVRISHPPGYEDVRPSDEGFPADCLPDLLVEAIKGLSPKKWLALGTMLAETFGFQGWFAGLVNQGKGDQAVGTVAESAPAKPDTKPLRDSSISGKTRSAKRR